MNRKTSVTSRVDIKPYPSYSGGSKENGKQLRAIVRLDQARKRLDNLHSGKSRGEKLQGNGNGNGQEKRHGGASTRGGGSCMSPESEWAPETRSTLRNC